MMLLQAIFCDVTTDQTLAVLVAQSNIQSVVLCSRRI